MKYATLQDLELELWVRKRNSREIIWKTKNECEIPIKDMSDNHLLNAIKKLRNYEEIYDNLYDLSNEDAGDRI